MADRKLLAIYLNDHLAGATVGAELTKRALTRNRGTRFAPLLETLLAEVEEDTRALEQVMDELAIRRSLFKRPAGVVAERLGRLKLNGQLTGYSPLSRVLELEGLMMGIHAKLSLWRNLRDTTEVSVDLERLIERAQSQLARLEEQRDAAARLAFGAPTREIPARP